MTRGELEEVYRRLCITIRRKTDIHAAIGRELEQLHREADELEYQIGNYDGLTKNFVDFSYDYDYDE